jgi:hypothetical protein
MFVSYFSNFMLSRYELTVLSQQEILALIQELPSVYQLVIRLLYGISLRLIAFALIKFFLYLLDNYSLKNHNYIFVNVVYSFFSSH